MGVPVLLGVIVISLLGLADAAFLTYEKLSNVTPQCDLSGIFDCGQVLNSPWSTIGGLPLSLFGMGFYAAVFLLASLMLLKPDHHPRLPQLLLGLSGFGFVFSLYLTGVQAIILQAFCFFCVLSAIGSTGIFALASIGYWQRRKNQETE